MLRASAQTNQTEVDLQAVNGAAEAAAGIAFGRQLMQFAESVAGRDAALAERRQALLEAAGPAVLADAAGVAANFQRMVRIADAIGIPVDDMAGEFGQQVRRELGIARFASAGHSLADAGQSPAPVSLPIASKLE